MSSVDTGCLAGQSGATSPYLTGQSSTSSLLSYNAAAAAGVNPLMPMAHATGTSPLAFNGSHMMRMQPHEQRIRSPFTTPIDDILNRQEDNG